MDHIWNLRIMEQRLREQVRKTRAGELGVSSEERVWILNQLSRMQEALKAHLAQVPVSEREYEEYRVEFELPLFTYLSRTYEIFHPKPERPPVAT